MGYLFSQTKQLGILLHRTDKGLIDPITGSSLSVVTLTSVVTLKSVVNLRSVVTLAFVVTLKSNVTLKLLITNQYDLFFLRK